MIDELFTVGLCPRYGSGHQQTADAMLEVEDNGVGGTGYVSSLVEILE